MTAPPATTGLAATTTGRDLKTLMTAVAGAVDERSTVPVLSHVRLEALGPAGGVSPELRATAYNGAWQIEASMPAAAADRPGVLVVPGGTLLRVAGKVRPDAEVALTVTPREGWLRLAADRFAVRLPTLEPETWPDFGPAMRDGDAGEAPTTVVLEAADLARLVEQVRFAMSQEPTRHHLNGVLLGHGRTPGTLGAVATDGHRMAVAEVPAAIEGGRLAAGAATHGRGVIVPRGAVAEMARLLGGKAGRARLTVKARLLVLDLDGIRLTARLLDAQYPDWTRVLPPDTAATEVRVARAALLAAAGRVGLVGERGEAVRLEAWTDGLALAGGSRGSGNEASEDVAAVVAGKGVRIGANPRFLADIASAAGGGDLVLGLNGAGDPMSIRAADGAARFALMPMRV